MAAGKGDLTERLERGRFSAVVKVNISLPALMGVFFKKFDIHEYAEYSMAATTLA